MTAIDLAITVSLIMFGLSGVPFIIIIYHCLRYEMQWRKYHLLAEIEAK